MKVWIRKYFLLSWQSSLSLFRPDTSCNKGILLAYKMCKVQTVHHLLHPHQSFDTYWKALRCQPSENKRWIYLLLSNNKLNMGISGRGKRPVEPLLPTLLIQTINNMFMEHLTKILKKLKLTHLSLFFQKLNS